LDQSLAAAPLAQQYADSGVHSRWCLRAPCTEPSGELSTIGYPSGEHLKGVGMIKTPYHFEADLSDQDFQKIGQFACRWALIEYTIANCLRMMLGMEMEPATIMIFPLSLDLQMRRISQLTKQRLPMGYQRALLDELRPLIKAMQYLRNTTLHGVAMSLGDDPDQTYFNLRSKGRNLTRGELFACEDLINYTAHVTQAFRLSLGDKTYQEHFRRDLREKRFTMEFAQSGDMALQLIRWVSHSFWFYPTSTCRE
jgi:hypothetical protein